MTTDMAPWKVLVVDDEEGIHGITRMIFRGYEFEQRPIELISAMSAAEAEQKLQQHPDIALVLLDVVMETDNAGLQLVEHIRHTLKNRHIRIILRTGHPGYAPEAEVIVNYDINDYLSKAELSASRLLTSVVVALRAYRDIESVRSNGSEQKTEPTTDNALLRAASEQLLQQSTALLKQTERLQRLELNPMVQEQASALYSQQQRLHNACAQLQLPSSVERQTLDLNQLLHQLMQTFLPQTRREGWLLDCSLSNDLPSQIQTDPRLLTQLLTTALELAIQRADGEDLKLSLQTTSQPDQLQVLVQQTSGQPHPQTGPWTTLLECNLHQLSELLGGSWLEDGDGEIRCRVRIG